MPGDAQRRECSTVRWRIALNSCSPAGYPRPGTRPRPAAGRRRRQRIVVTLAPAARRESNHSLRPRDHHRPAAAELRRCWRSLHRDIGRPDAQRSTGRFGTFKQLATAHPPLCATRGLLSLDGRITAPRHALRDPHHAVTQNPELNSSWNTSIDSGAPDTSLAAIHLPLIQLRASSA